ncbi:Ribosome-associated, YjgA [Corchorus olitorius]|uniref:Ribosome-associated, YjgA n=1 Tax=Corchorus olitorius TaxID=93759 RepID=A0A1R3HYH4_9ROSI|nr:Ribosome-associated, YjgA [Corchorus olitorius]
MARLIRPLRQWPQLQQYQPCCSRAALDHFLSTPLPLTVSTKTTSHCFSFATSTSSRENARHRPRGVRLRNAPPPSGVQEGETSDSDSDVRKSRNQKKREARRAVRWGEDLASFSTSQIKRILRVASIEEDVFDALMLVKRLGRDVREGKRRQFNYIGRLLREQEVEPELMDALIQATKVGDQKTLQALSGSTTEVLEEEDDEEDEYESEEIQYEMSEEYVNTANRWFDGLISKDIDITNEVYAVNSVDFDRQELRQLVRRVQMTQEQTQTVTEENKAKVEAAATKAKESLTRFLRTLARQLPIEQSFD